MPVLYFQVKFRYNVTSVVPVVVDRYVGCLCVICVCKRYCLMKGGIDVRGETRRPRKEFLVGAIQGTPAVQVDYSNGTRQIRGQAP